MRDTPETRPSLIARLQASADDRAWDEFAAIYRPAIIRLALNSGLQLADAEDVAQGVLVSVSKIIGQWKHDPERARFRTWLKKIVKNSTINALTRRPADQGTGGTTAIQSLSQIPGSDSSLASELEVESRRAEFRWASDEVRQEIHPATWEAFWLSAVEGLNPDEVARRTNKSIGAVYVARCRVMQRLQEKVRELVDHDLGDESRSPKVDSP